MKLEFFQRFLEKKKNVFRTNHPNFSFAIKGSHVKKYLKCKIDDAFGKGTVFDLFKKRDGKIICLGCDFNRITFVHHVEQLFGIKYRYLKDFYGKILLKKIKYINSKYFVRKIKIVKGTDLKLLKIKHQLISVYLRLNLVDCHFIASKQKNFIIIQFNF